MKNLQIYQQRLDAGIYDKLFWIDQIYDEKVKNILDFGCGTGTLIKAAQKIRPEFNYFGYDNNKDIIIHSHNFISTLEELFEKIYFDIKPEETILVFSSVLHEVYYYSKDLSYFYRLLDRPWRYIVIRDMIKSMEEYNKEELHSQILDSNYVELYKDFCTIYPNDPLQFLLKYNYIENWDREKPEYYFSFNHNILNQKFLPNREIIYYRLFNIPFVKYQIKKDFGIDLNINTHTKIILKDTT